MLSWLPRRRARIENIDAEAEALIRDLGDGAYSEALRREVEASSNGIAKDWSRVALAVVRKTGGPNGLDPATQMPISPILAPNRKPAAPSDPRPHSEPRPVEPKRVHLVSPQLFRIQFLGATPDREPTILKEIWIHAADVSAAIVDVAKTVWPPQTIGLRILDREGREVFGRQKADRG